MSDGSASITPAVTLRHKNTTETVSFLSFANVSTLPELMEPPHNVEISIDPAISNAAVSALILFIEKGTVDLTSENCTDVMLLANTFCIHSLASTSYQYICATLRESEITDRVLARTSASQNVDDLTRYFGERILKMKTSPNFFRLPIDVIVSALNYGIKALKDTDIATFCVSAFDTHGENALKILQLAQLSMVETDILTLLHSKLIETKPFPMFQYISSLLENRQLTESTLSNSTEQLHILQDKVSMLAQALKSALDGSKENPHMILAELLDKGTFIAPNPQESFAHYSAAAADGNLEAMMKVARCLETGQGAPKDMKKAMLVYEKLASAGNREAIIKLGHLCSSPESQFKPKDEIMAIQRAADLGDVESQHALGMAYLHGHVVKRDNLKGIELLRDAAYRGHKASFEAWQQVTASVNMDTNKQAAAVYKTWKNATKVDLKKLRLLVDAGYVPAIIAYGKMIMEGDEKHAAQFFQNCLDKGNRRGSYWMARVLLQSHSRGDNFAKALKYLAIAADLGHWKSQMLLGRFLSRGFSEIVRQPPVDYLEAAAKSGMDYGLYLAGRCYQYGLGVAVDIKKALACYQKLIEIGDPRGLLGKAKCILNNAVKPGPAEDPLVMLETASRRVDAAAFLYCSILLQKGLGEDTVVMAKSMLQKHQSDINCRAFLLKMIFSYFPNEKRLAMFSLREMIAMSVPIAKYMAGCLLLQGPNDTNGQEEGIYLIRDAADAMSPSALLKYGQLLLANHPTKAKREEALKSMWKAGELGLTTALSHYAVAVMEEDEVTGAAYLRALAQSGHVISEFEYGFYCFKHHIFREAARFLHRCVERNNMEAMYYYGMLVMDGLGVNRDLTYAKDLFSRSMKMGYRPSTYVLYQVLIELGTFDWAVQMLEGKARAGDAYAMYKLGSLALEGKCSTKLDPVEMIATAANMGCTDACWKYGTLLRDGNGVARDQREAVKWFEVSAKAGNPTGKVCLAHELISGVSVEKDESLALQLFKEAADQDNRPGMWCYANCLLRGIGCERDDVSALRVFKDLASFHDKNAQYQCGKMMLNGVRVPKNGEFVYVQDIRSGFEYLRTAADNGHTTAQWRMGYFYMKGIGVEKNEELGAHYLGLSAKAGNYYGMWHYAEALCSGSGVGKNPQEAVKYYQTLIAAGDTNAAYKYGVMLIEGINVEKNIPEGMKHLNAAVAAGNSDAQWKVGVMLKDGLCTCDNPLETAARLFRVSSDQNNHMGLWHYSQVLLKGEGVAQDTKAAMDYIRRAADLGNPEALLFCAKEMISREGKDKIDHGYFRALANSESPDAWLTYSRIVLEGGTTDDDERQRALALVQKGAKKGHIESRTYYGTILCEGRVVKGNPEVGAFYLKLAADSNDALAQCELGNCFLNGCGVPKNLEKATSYFQRSASNGCAKGREMYTRAVANT